jgi:hypothetical protein
VVDEKVHKPPLRKQEVTCADLAWLYYNGTFANDEKAVSVSGCQAVKMLSTFKIAVGSCCLKHTCIGGPG